MKVSLRVPLRLLSFNTGWRLDAEADVGSVVERVVAWCECFGGLEGADVQRVGFTLLAQFVF